MQSLYDSLVTHRQHVADKAAQVFADGFQVDDFVEIAKQFAHCSAELLDGVSGVSRAEWRDQVLDAAGKLYDEQLARYAPIGMASTLRVLFVNFCVLSYDAAQLGG